MDMVLAKTDLASPRATRNWWPDKELRERIFKRITEEHGNTLRCLELITGNTSGRPAIRCWPARSRTASPTSTR
jgi:phosphoenolpyruvate carboxylase